MEETTELAVYFYSLVTLILIIFATRRLFSATTTTKNHPPSPPKLPILGNLHQLGTHPHRSLHDLSKRYGPLMLLHFGNHPTLIVSSADAAKEIMKTHDLIFANRPYSSIARRLMYDGKDLLLANYGEYWRQMRSICVLQILNAKRVESFSSVREQEVGLLVEKIEDFSRNMAPVDLSEMFAGLTNDLVCRVAFGKKYNAGEGGKRFKKILEEFGELLGVVNVGDFIPWLNWINKFTGLDSRVDNNFKEFDSFIGEIINDHIANKNTDTGSEKDFVEVLLAVQNSKDGQYLRRDSIKAMILDMFAAGTDTVYTALEWIMTEFIRNPQVMKKAQDEIRSVTGNKQSVTEEDLEKMVYFKAAIKEAFRLHPPVPLLFPHESSQDVKIQGYGILAETRVIINFLAIARDPESWPEPEAFKPERFLEKNIDYKGLDFEFIPFGAGRRGCPGVTFAIAVIEIVLATLLHKFNWSLQNRISFEDLDITEAPGLSVHRKRPLVVIASTHSREVQ